MVLLPLKYATSTVPSLHKWSKVVPSRCIDFLSKNGSEVLANNCIQLLTFTYGSFKSLRHFCPHQRTVFFAGLNKEQCPETDISRDCARADGVLLSPANAAQVSSAKNSCSNSLALLSGRNGSIRFWIQFPGMSYIPGTFDR
jgi:hypothetical protein